MEKREREIERKVSELAASSSQNSLNSLTGGSSGECQTVARGDLGPEVAASSSQNSLSGSTCGNLEILGDKLTCGQANYSVQYVPQ